MNDEHLEQSASDYFFNQPLASSVRYGSNYLYALLLRFTVSWPAFSSWKTEALVPLVFVALVLAVAIVTNNHEFFLRVLDKLSYKVYAVNKPLLKKTTSMAGGDSESDKSDIHELKRGNVGGFGLKGRRPKMEDRMCMLDESDRLGVQLYGVFDGHGGDTAAVFVQKKLFTAIVNRLETLLSSLAIVNSNTDICNNKNELMDKQSPSVDTMEKKSSSVDRVEKKSLSVDSNDNNKENEEDSMQQSSTIKQQQRQSISEEESNDNCDRKTNCDAQSVNNQNTIATITANQMTKLISEEVVKLDTELINEFKKSANLAGTTSLFAMRSLSDNKLYVANVGDSRGVLCNSRGIAVPLSYDHKPQTYKEHKRIKEAGGFIKFTGVWRVAGVLATSRAMGDYPLKDKKLIIADPDVLVFDLNDIQPQFAILASDGLWDCFSNEDAVNFVRETLISLRKRAIKKEFIAFEAAKALANEAYRRLSVDNVSCIVIIFEAKEFTRKSGFVPSMSTNNRRKSSTARAIN